MWFFQNRSGGGLRNAAHEEAQNIGARDDPLLINPQYDDAAGDMVPVRCHLKFAHHVGEPQAFIGYQDGLAAEVQRIGDFLLVYFFTTIGINASFADLKAGGKPLLILLAITLAFLFAQNLIGIAAAVLLGEDASVGLLEALCP